MISFWIIMSGSRWHHCFQLKIDFSAASDFPEEAAAMPSEFSNSEVSDAVHMYWWLTYTDPCNMPYYMSQIIWATWYLSWYDPVLDHPDRKIISNRNRVLWWRTNFKNNHVLNKIELIIIENKDLLKWKGLFWVSLIQCTCPRYRVWIQNYLTDNSFLDCLQNQSSNNFVVWWWNQIHSYPMLTSLTMLLNKMYKLYYILDWIMKYLRHRIRLQGSVSISPVLRFTLEWVPSSSSQLPEHSDHSENSAENTC